MSTAFFLSLLPIPLQLSPSQAQAHIPSRSFLGRVFYRFGRHVASAQIRVLLITCLVVTTLLYPALAIHYQTTVVNPTWGSTVRGGSLFGGPSAFSSVAWKGGGLQSARPVQTFPFRQGEGGDAVLAYWEQEGFDVHLLNKSAEPMDTNLVVQENEVRLESIWIGQVAHLRSHSAVLPPHYPFNASTFTRHLALLSHPYFQILSCLPARLSTPLSSHSPWQVVHCFLEQPPGDEWDESTWEQLVDGALAGCLVDERVAWGRVEDRTNPVVWEVHNTLPASSPLSPPSTHHRSFSTPATSSSFLITLAKSLLPVPILALYTFLYIWTFRSLSQFTQVHSRFGLAFTYVIELAISTTCSGSICVVMGWKLEGVPWFLLPFVIAVVGLENMIHVTKAIVTTPVSLNVRERLGLGLAQAGPKITYTTMADIVILWVVGSILGSTVGAVGEFCRFAMIVLVADWFLIFTFFTVVISIDIQRLELADVLYQLPSNPSPVTPVPDPIEKQSTNPTAATPNKRRRRGKSSKSKSSSDVLVSGFQAVLRARTARNGSLILIMSFLMGLWYFYSGGFEPLQLSDLDSLTGMYQPSSGFDWLFSQRRPLLIDPEDVGSVWESIGLVGGSVLRVVVPSPTAFVVSTIPGQPHPSTLVDRFSPSSSRSILREPGALRFFFKIVILPISLTTLCLYGVLLFLLKDAELLDAQRNRLGVGEEWEDEEDERQARVNEQPTIDQLKGLHEADVSLVAASKDGSLSLSVGFDGMAVVWKRESEQGERLSVPSSSGTGAKKVVAAGVDDQGRFCALGFSNGSVQVWTVGSQPFEYYPLTFPSLANSSAEGSTVPSISTMAFLPGPTSLDGGFGSTLVVVRENGELVELDCLGQTMYRCLPPRAVSAKGTCLWVHGRKEQVEVAWVNQSGKVDVWRRTSDGTNGIGREDFWEERPSFPSVDVLASTNGMKPHKVTSAVLAIGGSTKEAIALATPSGLVSIWDSSTAQHLVTVQVGLPKVNQVRLVDPVLQQCGSCSERAEGFLVIASSLERVAFHRVASPFAIPCGCPSTRLSFSTDRISLEMTPSRRSPSFSGLGLGPPVPPPLPSLPPPPSLPNVPKRLPTTLSVSSNLSVDYPIAAHGVHSRRISVRGRRSGAGGSGSGGGGGGVDGEEQEEASVEDVFKVSGLSLSPGDDPEGSSWSHLRPTLLGTVSVKRGSWEVLEGRFVVGAGRSSSFARSDTWEETRSSAGSSAVDGGGRWNVWSADLHRLMNGPDMNISCTNWHHLRKPTVEPEPKDLTPGSSLRQRKAERARQFARQSVSPTVSHSFIGPIVPTGRSTVLAGTGNTLSCLSFPALTDPTLVSYKPNGQTVPMPTPAFGIPPSPSLPPRSNLSMKTR